MGQKYTSQATSGYNASPPADNGSVAESNKVKWSTVKTKLADVLKTFAEAINSQLVTTLDTSARAISASDSAAATDHWRTIQVTTAGVTVTLGDAATMATGYLVEVANQSTGDVSVALTTSTDTIDTITNATHTLAAKEARKYLVNATANGYLTVSGGNAVPAGSIISYAGTTAPGGWLMCYGQAVSRTTYASLFAAISTTYGVGDGSTTFNLPDLRGRVIAGQDDMGGTSANRLTNQSGGLDGDTLGATGGAETHTLTTAQLPASGLSIPSLSVTGSGTVTGGNSLGDAGSTFRYPVLAKESSDQSATFVTTNQGGTTVTGSTSPDTTGNMGTGGAHNNVQPTIVLNYIIKF